MWYLTVFFLFCHYGGVSLSYFHLPHTDTYKEQQQKCTAKKDIANVKDLPNATVEVSE
jgi:hypothetical protein